jgi:aspartokinase-like uncharacterized kinase
MPRPEWVVKIGGSLAARPTALRRLMASLGKVARQRHLLVVPGGGRFADEVRRADRRFRLGDSAPHWMAILAMDQYAYLLAQLAPRAVVVRGPRELRPGRLEVLAPSAWLMRADPLPHSWAVTSDSIAAWVAGALGVRRVVLVKHVDGFLAPARGPDSLPASVRAVVFQAFAGVVDPYLARALGPDTACWLVRGHLPHRLVRLLESARGAGGEAGAPRAADRRGRAPARARDGGPSGPRL